MQHGKKKASACATALNPLGASCEQSSEIVGAQCSYFPPQGIWCADSSDTTRRVEKELGTALFRTILPSFRPGRVFAGTHHTPAVSVTAIVAARHSSQMKVWDGCRFTTSSRPPQFTRRDHTRSERPASSGRRRLLRQAKPA
jgi:hypothetical protein